MNDAWTSEDIDTAIAELKAAGWKVKTPTIWASPRGKLFIGPAGAWRVMKRDANDMRVRPTERNS